ncbi:MAG: hypothetical protein OEZ34_11465 [Spirochaetia bacterium]|nr:hypothetical protein [Spirochaetia bacterium]
MYFIKCRNCNTNNELNENQKCSFCRAQISSTLKINVSSEPPEAPRTPPADTVEQLNHSILGSLIGTVMFLGSALLFGFIFTIAYMNGEMEKTAYFFSLIPSGIALIPGFFFLILAFYEIFQKFRIQSLLKNGDISIARILGTNRSERAALYEFEYDDKTYFGSSSSKSSLIFSLKKNDLVWIIFYKSDPSRSYIWFAFDENEKNKSISEPDEESSLRGNAFLRRTVSSETVRNSEKARFPESISEDHLVCVYCSTKNAVSSSTLCLNCGGPLPEVPGMQLSGNPLPSPRTLSMSDEKKSFLSSGKVFKFFLYTQLVLAVPFLFFLTLTSYDYELKKLYFSIDYSYRHTIYSYLHFFLNLASLFSVVFIALLLVEIFRIRKMKDKKYQSIFYELDSLLIDFILTEKIYKLIRYLMGKFITPWMNLKEKFRAFLYSLTDRITNRHDLKEFVYHTINKIEIIFGNSVVKIIVRIAAAVFILIVSMYIDKALPSYLLEEDGWNLLEKRIETAAFIFFAASFLFFIFAGIPSLLTSAFLKANESSVEKERSRQNRLLKDGKTALAKVMHVKLTEYRSSNGRTRKGLPYILEIAVELDRKHRETTLEIWNKLPENQVFWILYEDENLENIMIYPGNAVFKH